MAVMSRQEMHMYRLYTTYHSVFLVIATMKCIQLANPARQCMTDGV